MGRHSAIDQTEEMPLPKTTITQLIDDDTIKWKHFPCYWSFVRGIHRSPVDSPHKGLWRGVLTFSLICAWTNSWANTETPVIRDAIALVMTSLWCYAYLCHRSSWCLWKVCRFWVKDISKTNKPVVQILQTLVLGIAVVREKYFSSLTTDKMGNIYLASI